MTLIGTGACFFRDDFQTIFQNLQALLSFDEEAEKATVEDAFGLTFQVALTDATGSQVIFDLKENGQSISVTKDNREVNSSRFFSAHDFSSLFCRNSSVCIVISS